MTKCRRFASDLLESKDIEYDIQINAPLNRPLKLELRQHLWLIFKEMVTNAARHSNADKVDISLALSSGSVTMKVQDNGKGFKPEVQNEGNGVANIRKRAEQIDAELALESKAGIGTRYTLKVEL